MLTHETIRLDPLCLELIWHAGLLTQVRLSWSAPGDADRFVTNWSVPLRDWLRGYLAGKPENCPNVSLDWERVSGFSRQALSMLQAQVPPGQWVGYGELAGRCGRPAAARAVGRALAANPWPLLVPCHRVLGSAGQLTGFAGGLDIKLFLLKTEGVQFLPSGRADRENFKAT